MHWLSFALLLALSACSCSQSVECTTRDDCAAGLVCVNNECRSLEPAADGGPPESDGGSDAGVDAATCARACGDVDVDGDGDVDDADLAALPAVTSTDACILEAADADADGDYDADDEHALRALVSGAASGECEACGDCADVDGDGDVDADDATVAGAVVGSTPSACELLTIDVNRDGAVEQLDAWLVAGIADGRVTAECALCPGGRRCGDYNGDGDVNVSDGSALVAPTEGALAPCTHIASDVVRDGVIDRRDGHGTFWVITQELIGRTAAGACEPCVDIGMCGDVNGDGTIGSPDVIAIGNIEVDAEASVCERAIADLNTDGELNARDRHLGAAILAGLLAPSAQCPICTGVCGDVDQDGGLSGSDLTRFDAIASSFDASLCERDAADLDGNGNINARDERLLELAVMGLVSTAGTCAVCSPVCGDLTNDNVVTMADLDLARDIVGRRRPTVCEMENGDVDFDNDVDADDETEIMAWIDGLTSMLSCGR